MTTKNVVLPEDDQWGTFPAGMTLRDWFAGQALANVTTRGIARTRAEYAFDIADAMLAERERRRSI